MNRVTMFREFYPPQVYSERTATAFEHKILTGVKKHTIRAGLRWKVGDTMLQRMWTGLPYKSKQRQFNEVKIEKVWKLGIDACGILSIGNFYVSDETEKQLIANDGLNELEFWRWIISPIYHNPEKYKKDRWIGQVICWDAAVEYEGADL